MKFSVTADQKRHLETTGTLLLDGLFSDAAMTRLQRSVQNALRGRCGGSEKSADRLFREGYNLHVSSNELQQVLSQRALALIMAELLDCWPLRLGPDSYLPTGALQEGSTYDRFLAEPRALDKFSSIRGIAGGLMICLSAPTDDVASDFFPATPGSARLFKPEVEIPLPHLKESGRGSYLLATYLDEVALYTHNENDPHVHFLKHFGYVFGDKLREPFHAVILRKL